MQLYGRRAAWEDPASWVIDTYPWSATSTPADWPPLLQLRPEDVGFDGYLAPREGVRKEPPQSDSDADPLVSKNTREGQRRGRSHAHVQSRQFTRHEKFILDLGNSIIAKKCESMSANIP